jgi:ABC-type nitrate/sulfonate/bicarbonate transport system substrate-binding protein
MTKLMGTNSMRRVCLFFLIAWLTAVSAFPQDKAKTPTKLEAITLGVSAKHVLNLPIYMAQKYGILESEGIDVRLITAKTSTIIAALVARKMEYVTSFNSGLAAAVAGALTAVYVTTDKSSFILSAGRISWMPKHCSAASSVMAEDLKPTINVFGLNLDLQKR